MVDVSITVPERDLMEFRRIMDKLQTTLGKTPDKAVELGAVFVARALQAASRVSPRQRKVQIVSPYLSHTHRGIPNQWVAVDDRTANLKYIPIPGWWANRQDAQKQKPAQIRQSGLARLIWWKMASQISSQAGAHPIANRMAEAPADRNASVTIVHGEDASVKMDDSLRYALQGFKSSGRATVDDSMRRAANSMRKYIERQTGLDIAQDNMS